MATNAFGTPTNLNQFNAIVSGANKNSLVNQLFAGKTSQTTPMVTTPNVVAASSQVKSPSQTSVFNGGTAIPTNAFSTQPTPTGPQSTIPNTMSGTNGAPMSAPAAGPASLLPPTNQPVTSHSVTDAQGNTTVQKYDTSATNTADNSGGTANPNANYNAGVTPTNTGAGTPVTSNGGAATNTTYPGLISSLAGFNPFSNQNVSQPYNQAQELNTELQQSRTNEANAVAQNRLNPIPIGDQTGREAVLQNQYQGQQNALASELQGESSLYSTGLTGTGQQLSGLGTATSASAPITPSYSSQVLNPQTGQSVSGSSPALSTAISNAINQIKAGGGYANAAATLSAFGPAGTNALLSALGPSFNINASNAEAAAQASNIGTQGTLNTTIGAAGAQQATSNYVAAQTAYQTASSQATNLQNTLASTGINNNPQFVNQKINALQNQLGSANYASFITTLNETKQAYTSLLSSVGASTPTVNGQAATDIFNENSTPAQINAAIDALNTAAYAKLQPLYDQIGTYSNIGTSGSGSSSTANPWH